MPCVEEFESEAPVAEEMLCVRPCRMQQRAVHFQMCLQAVMVAELKITTGDREFQTAGAVILNALDWKLILVAG